MWLQFIVVPAIIAFAVGTKYFRVQVRDLLSACHSDVWSNMQGRNGFWINGLSTFIWLRRDRALADPVLSGTTAAAAWSAYLLMASQLVFMALALSGIWRALT